MTWHIICKLFRNKSVVLTPLSFWEMNKRFGEGYFGKNYGAFWENINIWLPFGYSPNENKILGAIWESKNIVCNTIKLMASFKNPYMDVLLRLMCLFLWHPIFSFSIRRDAFVSLIHNTFLRIEFHNVCSSLGLLLVAKSTPRLISVR